MAELEYDHNIHSSDTVDPSLLIKFTVEPKLDKRASREEGRPIYKDREFIEISSAGQRDSVKRVITQRDINMFPEHYKRFKARVEGEDHYVEGTLLKEWPAITRSLAEELAFLNVKTVEQLAAMNDNAVSNIRGGLNIREDAKAWLKVASDKADAVKLAKELDARDKKIARLEKQVEKLLDEKQPQANKEADY